jgi:thiol-disulfide isomerase/thioredoxin
MLPRCRRRWFTSSLALVSFGLASPAPAATPPVDQALKLAPIQKDVEFDQPTTEETKKCTIAGERVGAYSAWVVRDGLGQPLRRFVDTNNDNVVDQWCYFRNGVEVYRDIDANFNGKADQYRWLGTAGTRWAMDENEDGRIDTWKVISAEEVSAEVIKALADQDSARFQRLVLSDSELKSLGLGEDRLKELAAKVNTAGAEFAALARRQKAVGPKSAWVHFGASQPGVVPEGTDGSTKDLVIYENVLAMFEAGGTHGQVHVGTLIRVGDAWRLFDAPRIAGENQANAADSGIFFRAAAAKGPAQETTAGAPGAKMQELLGKLEALDKASAQAGTPAAQARYNAQRADLLEQLADEAASGDDRAQWIRQLADTVSAAAQSGNYPEGVERLKTLSAKLETDNSDDLAAYVKYRALMADYGASLQASNADFPKIQTRWLESLEQFVAAYPNSPDAAEAMMQLGIAQEFAGQEEDAKKWYSQIVSKFPAAGAAKKAKGAITRLESVGQVIRLSGRSTTGSMVDLAQYKGKLVLVHYWATWCDPCVSDLDTIKELYAKYGSAGFAPIGINLDANPQELASFLQKNRLNWPQIPEPGSLDGRMATDLGVLTLPTMILIDKDGRVLHRGITIGELETELKKRAAGTAGAAPSRR